MFLSLLSPSGTTGAFNRTLRGIVVASTAALVSDKTATLDKALGSLNAQGAAQLTSFVASGNQPLADVVAAAQAQLFANAATTAALDACQATSAATVRSFAAVVAQLESCSLLANDVPPVPWQPDARRTVRLLEAVRRHNASGVARTVTIATHARQCATVPQRRGLRQRAETRRHYALKG